MQLAFLSVSPGCVSRNELHHAAFLKRCSQSQYVTGLWGTSRQVRQGNCRLTVTLLRKALCSGRTRAAIVLGRIRGRWGVNKLLGNISDRSCRITIQQLCGKHERISVQDSPFPERLPSL